MWECAEARIASKQSNNYSLNTVKIVSIFFNIIASIQLRTISILLQYIKYSTTSSSVSYSIQSIRSIYCHLSCYIPVQMIESNCIGSDRIIVFMLSDYPENRSENECMWSFCLCVGRCKMHENKKSRTKIKVKPQHVRCSHLVP